MAYVSTVGGDIPEGDAAQPAASAPSRAIFSTIDRLVLVCGGLAFGAAAGLLTLIALGRPSGIDKLVFGSMLLMVALHLCAQTIQSSWARNASMCANTAIMHAIALLLWLSPTLALLTLVVLAIGWQGRGRVVYRLGLQAIIVGALGAYQGGLLLMAG